MTASDAVTWALRAASVLAVVGVAVLLTPEEVTVSTVVLREDEWERTE